MVQDSVILEIPCEDRKHGEAIYEVSILREFDKNYSLTPEKIADLWRVFREHTVLFSDDTEGKFMPFFLVLMDPRGVWFELRIKGSEQPVGVVYVTAVKPGHEADGHFAFWDSVGSGREPLALFAAEWIMDRYRLHRLSAHVPQYQSGTRRFIERLGFTREGVKREAVLHKGERTALISYGILRSELNDQISKVW